MSPPSLQVTACSLRHYDKQHEYKHRKLNFIFNAVFPLIFGRSFYTRNLIIPLPLLPSAAILVALWFHLWSSYLNGLSTTTLFVLMHVSEKLQTGTLGSPIKATVAPYCLPSTTVPPYHLSSLRQCQRNTSPGFRPPCGCGLHSPCPGISEAPLWSLRVLEFNLLPILPP